MRATLISKLREPNSPKGDYYIGLLKRRFPAEYEAAMDKIIIPDRIGDFVKWYARERPKYHSTNELEQKKLLAIHRQHERVDELDSEDKIVQRDYYFDRFNAIGIREACRIHGLGSAGTKRDCIKRLIEFEFRNRTEIEISEQHKKAIKEKDDKKASSISVKNFHNTNMLTKDYWLFVAILSGTTDFNNLTDSDINILCGPHGKNNEECGNLIDLCYVQIDRSGLRANDRNVSSSLKCWNKYVRGIIGDEPDCVVEEVVEPECVVEEVVEPECVVEEVVEPECVVEEVVEPMAGGVSVNMGFALSLLDEKNAKIDELMAKIAELESDKEKLKAAISVLSN